MRKSSIALCALASALLLGGGAITFSPNSFSGGRDMAAPVQVSPDSFSGGRLGFVVPVGGGTVSTDSFSGGRL